MSYRHKPGYMPWDRTGNRVLVQSELGRNKDTNYEIPDTKFAYGRNTFHDPEKANQLIYKWKIHEYSNNPNQGKFKDLIETNKAALNNMATTSPANSGFRKSQTMYKQVKRGSNYIKIKLPQQHFTYGKPLDTEDPIRLVMRNDYGETDKMFRHTMYQMIKQKQQQPRARLSFHITKNQNLMKDANMKRATQFDWANRQNWKDKWKLSKFSDVVGKVDTNLKGSSFKTQPKRNQNNSNVIQNQIDSRVGEAVH